MPSSPTPLCLDCSSRAVNGTKYCAKHQTHNNASDHRHLYDRYRADDPIRALYRCARWIKGTRLIVLRRDILCQYEGGCPRAANVCDHHPLSAREIVEQFGVDEFYNPARNRGLCKQHHDMKTATQDSSFAGGNRQQASKD